MISANQLHEELKTKGHFPSEESALKLLLLALRNIEKKKWRAPPAFWKRLFVQLLLHFGEDRVLK